MKRASRLVSMVTAALVICSGSSVASASTAYVAKVKLHPKPPVTITPSEPVRAMLILPGTRFTSIDTACFTFTFLGDLLDPGESVLVSLEGAGGAGFGFLNLSSSSTTMRTVCLASGFHDQQLDLLLDGREKFTVTTEDGSVRLSDLGVVITGTTQ